MLETGGRRYVVPRPGACLGEMEATEIDVVGGRAYLDMLVAEQVLSSDQIAQELLDARGEAVESGVRVQLEQTQKIMEMLSADLSFAFMAEDRLIGFMNLRDDRTRKAFFKLRDQSCCQYHCSGHNSG